MELIRSMFFFCVLLVVHTTLYAQQPLPNTSSVAAAKPLLFASLPDHFEIDGNELQKIFRADLNSNISLKLSGQFSIEGKLVDKNQHNAGSVSVNIRVANYSNALFNVTLRLLADNSATIHGRILHPRYGDVLQVYKEHDRYFIKKISQALFMPE